VLACRPVAGAQEAPAGPAGGPAGPEEDAGTSVSYTRQPKDYKLFLVQGGSMAFDLGVLVVVGS
jgi:hypothetical protein